ncbi:MAG: cupin domain-containing protein [bacterium]
MEVQNLLRSCQALKEYWSPKIIGEMNGQYIKVAKLKGEFVWHTHEAEDELFIILQGRLIIHYDTRQIKLSTGDMHIVPKGYKHKPIAPEECLIALIEPKQTQHTGNEHHPMSKSISDQLNAE